MTTLSKKFGAADLLGNVAKLVRENFEIGETKLAYGVSGVCEQLEEGTSTFGEWIRFNGEFDGINYFTGEVFQSAKCHVPAVLEAILKKGTDPLRTTTKELLHSTVTALSETIEFAFVVKIKRNIDDEKGGVSWEYICEPKTEVKENKRISHLTALLPSPTVHHENELAEPVVEEKVVKGAKK